VEGAGVPVSTVIKMKTMNEVLQEMQLQAFIESVESSNRLEGIIVSRERIEEICIGTYDVED